MIATPTHIQQASETLPAPAICTPADFNQYLARAKARALAALVRIIDDPATPPDEVRKAATAITRTQFLPMPKPNTDDAERHAEAVHWGACDSTPTSSTTIELEKFNATVREFVDDEDENETEVEATGEVETDDEVKIESEAQTEAHAEPLPSNPPHNHAASEPASPHTPLVINRPEPMTITQNSMPSSRFDQLGNPRLD